MMHLKKIRAVAFAVAVFFLAASIPTPAKADMSFGFSYSNLSPHGSWLVSAQYGRVWRPSVAVSAGWNPYYDGHWVYTDLGWTWVSDYPWGAIPYHYGTWIVEPGIGWVWLPGEVWAPSWVVFCDGPDYIGWAPVPPHYSVGVSVSFNEIGYDHFVVVPAHDFLAPRIRGIAVPQSRTSVIINNTKIVNKISVENNVVVNNGPDVNVVERATHKQVKAVPIERVHKVSPTQSVDREQLRFDKGKGGRPKATEPVSVKSTAPSFDSRNQKSIEKRGTTYQQQQPARQQQPVPKTQQNTHQQQQPAPKAQTTQRKQTYQQSSPSARQQPRRDTRQPEQSAVPAQRQGTTPNTTQNTRQQYRQTNRKPEQSAAPAQKKAPVNQQAPARKQTAKSPPKDKPDHS